MSALMLTTLAWADPLVDQGSVRPADRAAAGTGRPATVFEVVPLASLGDHPPVLIGPGRLLTCTGAPGDTTALRTALQQASGALSYGEFDRADIALQAAEALAQCPAEPLGARDLADIDRGRGVLAIWREQPEAAAAWFDRASALDPGAPAGEDWPPAAAEAWKTATTRPTAAATLTVVAPLPGVVLTVDGVGVPVGSPLPLRAGRHVAWLSGPLTMALPVELNGGDVRVVVPSAFPDGRLDDPTARPELSARFEGVFGPGAPVLVATERQIFRTTGGDPSWEEIHRVRTPPTLTAGRIALGAGGAALVGGAIPAILAYAHAGTAADDMTHATSTEGWQEAQGRWTSSRATFAAAAATGIGGAVITSLGLAVVIASPDPFTR